LHHGLGETILGNLVVQTRVRYSVCHLGGNLKDFLASLLLDEAIRRHASLKGALGRPHLVSLLLALLEMPLPFLHRHVGWTLVQSRPAARR